MNMKYILYNPNAGDGQTKKAVDALQASYENTVLINMDRMSSYKTFFNGLEKDADIILCGGDGTLNHFANATKDITIENSIYYFPLGIGNDFARDLGYEKYAAPDFCVNEYLTELPSVTVNGETRLFLNNVGFGIDGYCTEVGDKLREQNRKNETNRPIDYTEIAIKGLLRYFKPRNAVVTVDGKKYTYNKVWLAPCMNGRYYGCGMMAAPKQNRRGTEHKVSLVVFHGADKLRALMIFPSIFKGEHVKYAKQVSIFEGHDITVEFDRPTPLQIDGGTILGVTSYSVHASNKIERANATERFAAG